MLDLHTHDLDSLTGATYFVMGHGLGCLSIASVR
jgi:hypothetical protein